MWEIEKIHDYHCLYVRIHKDFISSQDGLPRKTAFTNTPKSGDNLSSDWCKFTSPELSRELIGRQKSKGQLKDPLLFFIWRFSVLLLRQIEVPRQEILHQPIFNDPEIDGEPNNRAHSIIVGRKPVNEAEFRTKLLRAGRWAIPPS